MTKMLVHLCWLPKAIIDYIQNILFRESNVGCYLLWNDPPSKYDFLKRDKQDRFSLSVRFLFCLVWYWSRIIAPALGQSVAVNTPWVAVVDTSHMSTMNCENKLTAINIYILLWDMDANAGICPSLGLGGVPEPMYSGRYCPEFCPDWLFDITSLFDMCHHSPAPARYQWF